MSQGSATPNKIRDTVLMKLRRRIHTVIWHVRSAVSAAWWKFMPGTVISISWPSVATGQESSDPNQCFRPWMEQHVGWQTLDWDWCLGDISAYNGRGELLIKFRRGREQYASLFVLTWSQPC